MEGFYFQYQFRQDHKEGKLLWLAREEVLEVAALRSVFRYVHLHS